MYIGASKPHTTLVVEHAFLLCKPDSEQHHRYILQTVSDAGFLVLAKSFIITPALAEELASKFQSVRKRRYAERGVEKIFSGHKLALQSDNASLSTRRRKDVVDRDRLNGTAADDLSAGGEDEDVDHNSAQSSASSGEISATIKRHRSQETHQGIIAEIICLTSRHTDEEGVNAGLPNVADEHRTTADGRGTEGNEGRADSRMQQEHKPERRVVTGMVLKNTMIEAMSYKELLDEHVRHLAFGGTCLAVELSRHNAVEKLLEIVGPENPIDARRVAPYSLRARLGTDLVRNAVYAASNLAEASHCISTVFGFATRYSAADVRAHTAMPEAGGAKNDEQVAGTPAIVRPHCKLVSAALHPLHGSPFKPAAALRIEKANPQAHLSYYTGQPGPGQTQEKEETDDDVRRGQPDDAGSWKKKAEQLEQQLAQGQMELMMRAKLLRARELDLLLRERALEKATHTYFAPAQPIEGNMKSNLFLCPLLASVEEQIGKDRLSPFMMQGQQQQLFSSQSKLNDAPLSQSVLEPRSPQPQHVAAEMPTATARGMLPVIEAEDVSLLLTRPVRLRALYVALKHSSENGELTRKAVLALYDRSPAVQLLWMDGHREFFQRHVEEHTEEPVSFDSFVCVLMFLLKQ
ncbi:putative nucleoside diphosphate kinase [Trypanosoma rangeli]|uniref:Putative nucleoside diphosphate kinase n=1 Tax=Trypanosoma rangeli TaxID=5698 RepID=A0A422NGP5_TRYRA|nr:putative nucleoside diphosphate kinase [Trypanosoma rangeli]RNF04609.1 putative nucleoside diphosphate kinase [Trypanosoma rangeli]|eukprot:RNF04609.1 putative nucleoside diphosphate kinase [Trypanosoma rangeli]